MTANQREKVFNFLGLTREPVLTWEGVKIGRGFYGKRGGTILVEIRHVTGVSDEVSWTVKGYLPGFVPRKRQWSSEEEAKRAGVRYVLSWFHLMAYDSGDPPAVAAEEKVEVSS
jgi:hypothetical protein